MKILRTILVACGLASITACGDVVSPVAPVGPRYDQGGFSDASPEGAEDATQADGTTVGPFPTEETVGGTKERGTFTVGSGG